MSKIQNIRELWTRHVAERARVYIYELLTKGLFFIFVYLLTNEWAARAGHYYHFYFEFERNFPFVPEFIFVYVSVYPLLILLPAFLFEPAILRPFAREFFWMTVIAGICFVLFPAELGFSREVPAGTTASYFQTLHEIDRPHNLAPSLHVALAALLSIWTSRVLTRTWAKSLIWFWFAIVCLSVVLVRQHHFMDIVSGVALTCSLHFYFQRRAVSVASRHVIPS